MTALDPTDAAVIVIAKEPRPGRCKTRLCPPLGLEQAAEVAAAALADTLATVASAGTRRRVLALDGRPGPWVPPGFEVVPQAGGSLGERIAAAFACVGGPALLIGMDTPQLHAAAIDRAARELARDDVDAVLGPSADGGYWAIGLGRPLGEEFSGVPMSSPSTAAAQRRRLRHLGLRWRELEVVRDVDTFEDARAVAALCPRSAFARALERIACPAAA